MKFSKEDVRYIRESKEAGRNCSACVHFRESACAFVVGVIEATGSCSLIECKPSQNQTTESDRVDDQLLRVCEETNGFEDRHFVEVLSDEKGIAYEWLDADDMNTEEKAKNPAILGIMRMPVMMKADDVTRNGTIYPMAVVKREVERLCKERIDVERPSCYMAADHPDYRDGYRVNTKNAAAYLTKLSLDERTGIVSGEAVVIAKDAGRDVAAIFRSGGFIGDSSRGYGSAREADYKGIHGELSGRVLQDNFRLEGFDFVLDPSVRGARVDAMKEEKEVSQMNKRELKEKFPEVYDAILSEGRLAQLEDVKRNDSAFVSKSAFDEKCAELSAMSEAKEAVSGELALAQNECKEKDELIETLESKHKELEKTHTETVKQLEEKQAEVERAAAEAYLSETLATHAQKENILKRISDTERATLESAKAAAQREIEYLVSLGIPAAPISENEIKKRTGKPPADPEDATHTEESETVRRMNRIAGI